MIKIVKKEFSQSLTHNNSVSLFKTFYNKICIHERGKSNKLERNNNQLDSTTDRMLFHPK